MTLFTFKYIKLSVFVQDKKVLFLYNNMIIINMYFIHDLVLFYFFVKIESKNALRWI